MLSNLFQVNKPAVAMVQLRRRPGWYRYRGEPLPSIIAAALDEVTVLAEAGFDGLLLRIDPHLAQRFVLAVRASRQYVATSRCLSSRAARWHAVDPALVRPHTAVGSWPRLATGEGHRQLPRIRR
jgi:hypothetical protein